MTRATLLLLSLAWPLAACVNFAVPFDDEDWMGAGAGEIVGREGLGEGVDGRPSDYPDSLVEFDPSWCVYDDTLVSDLRSSRLIEADEFAAEGDGFQSFEGVCELVGSGPERVFRLEAPVGTAIRARLVADWDAVLTLTQAGCRLGHVRACRAGLLADVMADPRYWLFLEGAALDPTTGAAITGPFTLQIALNKTSGHAQCPVEREVDAASLIAAPARPLAQGGCVREIWLEGDTRLADDHVFLACDAQGAPLDAFGGAPDHAVRITPDFPDGQARLAEVRVETDGSWEPLLGVTGASCGAVSDRIDCAGGSGGLARVADLLLVPGAPLVVFVDGLGDRLPQGQAAGPYTLAIRTYEPCQGL